MSEDQKSVRTSAMIRQALQEARVERDRAQHVVGSLEAELVGAEVREQYEAMANRGKAIITELLTGLSDGTAKCLGANEVPGTRFVRGQGWRTETVDTKEYDFMLADRTLIKVSITPAPKPNVTVDIAPWAPWNP